MNNKDEVIKILDEVKKETGIEYTNANENEKHDYFLFAFNVDNKDIILVGKIDTDLSMNNISSSKDIVNSDNQLFRYWVANEIFIPVDNLNELNSKIKRRIVEIQLSSSLKEI